MGIDSDHRFGHEIVPLHYQIVLEPDIAGGTFSGSEVVAFELNETTDAIVLNTIELDIVQANVTGNGHEVAAAISYDEDLQRATLALGETIESGTYQLSVTFTGILNDQLHGFYLSRYIDPEGNEKTIATSQLQATDARRAFPCWDQPDLKATFGVTLIVEAGHMAIANGPEIGRTTLDNGKVEVRFATTMKMSTYIVAFVVGELEASETIDVDGVPLRVIHAPGKGDLTAFALEVGAFCLRYFADYYGVPYPGQKMDMLAIPDFAWGAMENLGAVTYRETALLVDTDTATQAELNRVALVIAHELAHMWFGDLVTMGWWEGIWLNEAFATFMENKGVDAFRPDWNQWLAFGADRQNALEIDALHATRPIELAVGAPDEAAAMFDTLTYEKGGAVLRMLEQYLGEGVFRKGISLYLKKHSHANTVTSDLWHALGEASGEPVAEIMESWIYQGGYPRLSAARTTDGKIAVFQEHYRFLDNGDDTWMVPLLYSSDNGSGRVIVQGDIKLDLGANPLLNAGGSGFFSIGYDDELLGEISGRLHSLDAEERFSIISDTWSSVLSGDVDGGAFLDLVSSLGGEREPAIWSVIVKGISELDNVVSSDRRPELQKFVRDLMGDVGDELGWEAVDGEPDLIRQLRGIVLSSLGALGQDPGVRAHALAFLDAAILDPTSVDGDVAAAALHVVASDGSVEDFEGFVDAYRDAPNAQVANRYLRAAAAVPEDSAAQKLFEMVLDGSVRRQDSFWVLALMLGQRQTGAATWQRITERWDEVLATMPKQNVRRMFDLIQNRSEPEIAAEIKKWLDTHPLGGAAKLIQQQLERLEIRVGLREREATTLAIPHR